MTTNPSDVSAREAQELRQMADDPMWADHAEISKVRLRRVAALLDSQAKLLAELEWRDIASVPKDGTPVWLICTKCAVGYEERIGFMAVDYWHLPSAHAGFESWGKFNTTYWPPTHWMYPPSPPKLSEPT